MERLKSLDPPHKGLRNLLGQFSLLAGQTCYSDVEQITKLKDLGKDLFQLLENHAFTEETFILAPLKNKVANLTAEIEEDHTRLALLEQELKEKLHSFDGTQTDDDGHDFYLLFSDFHSQYLIHIADEDRNLEVNLQANFTDEELIQHQIAIMQSMDFSVLLLWFKYIVPARRIEENVQVLNAFKSSAPPEAFEMVLTTIRGVLTEDRYATLISGIN
jgi:hypothetical protein